MQLFKRPSRSKQLLLASAICLSLSGLSTPSYAAAATATMDIQQVLQEQRTWARLSTKTIKVTDADPLQTIDWSYSEGGDTSKPTILLIHGLAGSRDNWNQVANKLTPFYHVIIPDLPGHGDTKAAEGYDYQLPNIVPSLRRFLEAIHQTQDLHVAGHSLGGALALVYASLYFQDTQSLLLVDAAGVYASSNSPYQKDPTLIRDILVKQPGDMKKLMGIAMANPPFIPQSLLNLQEQLMIKQAPGISKVIDKLIENFKFYSSDTMTLPTKAIEAPTLVIWGAEDKVFDVAVVKELTDNLKNDEPAVILPGVGHSPILEADQIVAEHYLAFLRGAGAKHNKFAVAPTKP